MLFKKKSSRPFEAKLSGTMLDPRYEDMDVSMWDEAEKDAWREIEAEHAIRDAEAKEKQRKHIEVKMTPGRKLRHFIVKVIPISELSLSRQREVLAIKFESLGIDFSRVGQSSKRKLGTYRKLIAR